MEAARALLAESLRAELRAGKTPSFVTAGSSMGQSLPPGCVAEVSACVSPRLDDFLVFVPDRGPLLCCHRVIGHGPRGEALTQGDAHLAPDGLIAKERFVGVVRRYRRAGRSQSDLACASRPPSSARALAERIARASRQTLASSVKAPVLALRRALGSMP
jgi:hypothetical protein